MAVADRSFVDLAHTERTSAFVGIVVIVRHRGASRLVLGATIDVRRTKRRSAVWLVRVLFVVRCRCWRAEHLCFVGRLVVVFFIVVRIIIILFFFFFLFFFVFLVAKGRDCDRAASAARAFGLFVADDCLHVAASRVAS